MDRVIVERHLRWSQGRFQRVGGFRWNIEQGGWSVSTRLRGATNVASRRVACFLIGTALTIGVS